jgi:hypothetical protein
MWRPAKNNRLMKTCLVLFFLTVMGFATAQDATPPPPPPDAPSTSIQQPAPGSDVRAVRVSDVQGPVQVLDASGVAFSQAQVNMPVVEGMKFVTADSGHIEIQFEDGSVARVTPNSSVTLTQLARDASGSTLTTIEADSGLTYYELNSRGGEYTVRFGRDQIGPVGASIFRLNMDNKPTELAVTHGSVHVSDDENLSVDVRTNQSIRFDAQNAAEYEMVQGVTANSWDQWNSDRDQALSELDASATMARASSGNPDNPAWSDLDASGDWYDVPGYGEGWAPSGVGADWDPYGVGSWGYYPGVGYTWISGYSWGWWPYRCGGWNWFGGSGWMWFPGNCGWGGLGLGIGWRPYGRLWRVPPGYKAPLRPGPVHHREAFSGGRGADYPLIAVNRGPQFTQQFRGAGGGGGAGTAPRTFEFNGESIAPLQPTIRARQGGPLGEGFTTRVEHTYPGTYPGMAGSEGVTMRHAYEGPGYRPAGGADRPGYQPVRTYTPPPASRPAPSGGGRVSAPPPSFHAPAAASSGAAGAHH